MTVEHLASTLSALDADWHDLVNRVPSARLDERLAAIEHDPDAALLGLLAAHALGDPYAGRIILQAMLGKFVRMAWADPAAHLDDYLAAAWERIATYPLATRRNRVAANLALDTLKAVKRETRPAAGVPTAKPEPPALAGYVLAEAHRLGVIDATARRVLEVVYLDGRSSSDAARHLGSTPGAVRVRCHRAVRALRVRAPELTLALSG